MDLIPDTRRVASVTYGLQDCYRGGFAMFYLQDPSLHEFQRRFQDHIQSNILSTVFGVQAIPADTQLRQILDEHEHSLLGMFSEQDGSSRQDCGITAGRRAIEWIRAEHPQLGMLIVADSLYSTAPTIRHLSVLFSHA